MVKHFSSHRMLVHKCYGRSLNGLVFIDMYLISSYRISKEGINMHVKIILLFLCFFQVNSCPSGQRRRTRPENGLPPRQGNNYQTLPPYNQVDYFLPSSLQYIEYVTILYLLNFWFGGFYESTFYIKVWVLQGFQLHNFFLPHA